ncbi:hypothetical protein BDV26DRAFT_163268 [Aspergillus bertholletiae]|uniref:Aminoglycoside phosphotransferase domain-containing protein n=1 Tax=Aspergillus bertholletiae TaxID=1226010 RepID=A0A5N7BCV0_9EURO|nr:hypothetical protein BDV26DRAFT_163268 [Aspergillus bertholletiae]
MKDEKSYNLAAREAERKEITRLLDKVNVSALLSQASSLRDGIPCCITQSLQYDRSMRSSVMDGMNYHIEIRLEDGINWLLRIQRLNATSLPEDLRAYIMRSEVATLQFLSKTKVPVSKAIDYNLDGQNPIGIEYILMEKMAGQSLRWSFLPPKAETQSPESANRHICRITGGSIRPNGLLRPTRNATYRAVRARIVDGLQGLSSVSHGAIPVLQRRFYLRHADNKGDHILVDSEYNITGIVDLEWAHTDVKSAAFNSPVMLLPIADFYNGKNQLGEDELVYVKLLEDKGHRDLAEIVKKGRILHRIEFCLGYDLADWEGFLGIFQGPRKALEVDGDLEWDA